MNDTSPTVSPLFEHPVIVIGIPCFNEQEFLEQTLASVQRQTWTDFAVLISDNASTDRTGEIARAFCEKDRRFHYHSQAENIGSARNFNFIADHSDSPYLLWIGAHDLIEPGMLAYHIDLLERRAEVSLSHSVHAWIDSEGQFVKRVEDGDLDGGTLNDPARYLRSIKQNQNNIGANSVIRRSMLGDIRFTDVVGTDRILISHLAFRGPFAKSEEVLYIRRFFKSRVENDYYMERLTGKLGLAEDWDAFAEEHDRDFARLLDERSDSKRLRRALALRLRYYFPVKRRSFITHILWTVRRLRKVLNMIRRKLIR